MHALYQPDNAKFSPISLIYCYYWFFPWFLWSKGWRFCYKAFGRRSMV